MSSPFIGQRWGHPGAGRRRQKPIPCPDSFRMRLTGSRRFGGPNPFILLQPLLLYTKSGCSVKKNRISGGTRRSFNGEKSCFADKTAGQNHRSSGSWQAYVFRAFVLFLVQSAQTRPLWRFRIPLPRFNRGIFLAFSATYQAQNESLLRFVQRKGCRGPNRRPINSVSPPARPFRCKCNGLQGLTPTVFFAPALNEPNLRSLHHGANCSGREL